jgi:hypothetical protein
MWEISTCTASFHARLNVAPQAFVRGEADAGVEQALPL